MKRINFLCTSLLLSTVLCSAFFYGCKKKEIETPAVVIPAHCSNGIIDGGELNTDCGGECSPCSAITAPCAGTITNNTATLAGFPDLTMYFVNCNIQSGNYTIVGNSTNGDIRITLSGAKPTVNRAYYFIAGTGPSSILAEGVAQVHMSKGFSGSFYASGGKLYVAIVNGKVEVTFCSIIFQGDQTSGDFLGSGKVICM